MAIDATSRNFDWEGSTTDEKLEFLYRWCQTLESMVNSNRHEAITRIAKLETAPPQPGGIG
jgi:hypothetical protein